ncbi:PEBP-like protein [Sodiomyces alkalinus F11]|uniref:PEBP-like protein n=1 Tax=Sodiomyces alkalinus (strain CBS 110278 / VKM F-3762 / F11) TaxID=1314773 RepID=A0A3N2Q6X4_SODAK|nr:PEBP-like protein [Sodiomyces alkalinus F11]ROT42531.1 PEBP-like protein [Sodiomyces alkalinus F11]
MKGTVQRLLVLLALLTLAPIIVASLFPSDQHIMSSKNNDMVEVQKRLFDAEIIPTVIDVFKPIMGLSVEWGGSKDAASLGNTLDPSHLQSSPTARLERADPEGDSRTASILRPGMTYVLTLTDPDAPSRDDPKWSEFCHWIASGLVPPSSASSSSLPLADLKDVMSYKPPSPPPETGKHRYVFLVFVPANGTSEPLDLSKPGARKHWGGDKAGHGVKDWADTNGLLPIAANFIYAQNEKQ